MAEQSEDMNTDGNNDVDCHRLTSPGAGDNDQLGARNGYKFHRAISPFRSSLEKLLVVITIVLFIICIVFVVLFALEKSKGSHAVSNNGVVFDEYKDTACLYSDEAMRVGLPEFLNRVKKTYYDYTRMTIEWEPTLTIQDISIRLKERFLPLNVTPAFLKQMTDAAFSLLDEIKKKDMDENIMKPREEKAIQQVKLFLRTVFGNPYDKNFYDGDWLLGPNHFCWQSICAIDVAIYSYGLYVKPVDVSELEEVLRKLELVGETLEQYMSNMKLGVKVGMVRSETSCRAGFDAFSQKFKKISKKNNPKDVLDEWFVKHFRNASFIEIISKDDKQSWLDSKGESMLKSIDDALVEGIGRRIVKVLDYLQNDHQRHCLPHSVSSGISSLPVDYIYVDGVRTSTRTTKKLPLTGQPLDGRTAYVNMLPYFTTSDITPDEINKIGEERLKALYPQAVEVAKNITGEADSETAIREFKKKLNDSSQNFNTEPFPANESDSAAHKNCTDIEQAKIHCPKRWEAMVTWSNFCRQTMGMLAPKLIPLFYHTGKKITVPNCPMEMNPDFNPSSGVQSFEHSGPTCYKPSYYNLPFFLNNYGPKFAEWSITAHEGWPGHHTQVQGQQEYFRDKCGGEVKWLDEMSSSTFFDEGWGLYAENPLIAVDTDTYTDEPLQKYGMLQWQIWRALRLIVDTGIHYRGMNRSTALGLFAKYAWDETDLSRKEVTRYQGSPGQATSYMLGQQKIVQLRKYCESELGEEFDKQEFHYQVLSHGSVPEAYLDKHIKKYVKCTLDEMSDENCDSILNASTKELDYSSKLGHKFKLLQSRPFRLRYV